MINERTTGFTPSAAPGGDAERIYTPSELNRDVKRYLESGFSRIMLEGEISNLSRPGSGHMYFSLKDDGAQVRCALFRSAAARVGIAPENGMKVLVSARISLYEARGEYQLIVDSLQHAGAGLLQQKFEKLKAKLKAEGLFELERRKPLPPYPLRIALVTSSTGAAVSDMVHVLQRRWPIAVVRLYPVAVQGAEAAPAIVRALEALERHAWAQVVLLGRGGGSLEDLWAFNEETVARAIGACRIPVISAVGHETDFTIADFVADMRAPTPSAAAEMCVPDAAALQANLTAIERAMSARILDRSQGLAQKIDHFAHRLALAHPRRRLDDQARRLRDTSARMHTTLGWRLERWSAGFGLAQGRLRRFHPGKSLEAAYARVATIEKGLVDQMRSTVRSSGNHLAGLAQTLHALSPLKTVGRGYALLTTTDTNKLISSVAQIHADQKVSAQLRDGRLNCTVDSVDERAPSGLDFQND